MRRCCITTSYMSAPNRSPSASSQPATYVITLLIPGGEGQKASGARVVAKITKSAQGIRRRNQKEHPDCSGRSEISLVGGTRLRLDHAPNRAAIGRARAAEPDFRRFIQAADQDGRCARSAFVDETTRHGSDRRHVVARIVVAGVVVAGAVGIAVIVPIGADAIG